MELLSSAILWCKPYRFETVDDFILFTVYLPKKTFHFVWDDVNNSFTDLSQMRNPVWEEKRVFRHHTGIFYCEKSSLIEWFDTLDEICEMNLLNRDEKDIVLNEWKKYHNRL
jgi:hypothetical protein